MMTTMRDKKLYEIKLIFLHILLMFFFGTHNLNIRYNETQPRLAIK